MNFKIGRGTNISHWLSQSTRRASERRAFFGRDDVRRIADWGLDHLRLPVDEVQLWEAGPVGEQPRETEAFDLLNEALDWCHDAGLKAVVDLHILRSHHFLDREPALFADAAEADRFTWFWGDLSTAMRGRTTDDVAFELMNEPVATEHDSWNRVFAGPYALLRAQEPRRTIVLGSNRWNQCWTFDALKIPAGDEHLLLTFHYYNPMLVTHYRAAWAEKVKDYKGPVHYPGRPIAEADWEALPEPLRLTLAGENRPYDAAEIEKDIALPLAVAARTGLPLYCGEFGVVANTPDDVRLAWYRDFRSVLAKHGIGWANWDYKGGFGLIDAAGQRTAAWAGLLTAP